ncbi:MAG: ribonuclease J [Alphaproteobacteria bacterium]|nr:ribonuclease J [Alphaproteobacteria bacterium]
MNTESQEHNHRAHETRELISVPLGLRPKPLRKQKHSVGIGERALNSSENQEESSLRIPAPEKGTVRIIALDGVERVGKNMHAMEYDGEIIIFDAGFSFKDPTLPGVDCTVPNVKYLADRKHMIKAILISHGHLDHIGAIPYIMDDLGHPPIYSRRLTIALIKHRQQEFTHMRPLDLREIETNQVITVGNFTIKFFAVTHTIPDAMGILVQTPYGHVAYTGDLKLSHENEVVDNEEFETFAIFEKEKILVTIADSTNAENPGFSKSEKTVVNNIIDIVKKSTGRLIISSFSSQIDRNIQIIEGIIAAGKKVVIEGRSMLTNLSIAYELGIFKVDPQALIPVAKCGEYPKEKLVILATGSQGEEYAALDRMSKGTHKQIVIDDNDTVIFSSSTIPGNETAIQNVKDQLSRLGAAIVTYQTSDVHSSGHANKEELRWIHNHMKPKFFIPVHGFHYMLTAHARILRDIGMPKENIIIPNAGSIIDFVDNGKRAILQKYTAPNNPIVVDGNAIGSVQEVVLRDRKSLGEQGIFVCIIMINQRTNKLRKSPDIISRGFIYMRESQDLVNKARIMIKNTVEEAIDGETFINVEDLKKYITKRIESFLISETHKEPIVVPVIFIS